MKQSLPVFGLILMAGFATAVAVAGGRGPGDPREIAAGIAVASGLLAVATPLLWLARDRP